MDYNNDIHRAAEKHRVVAVEVICRPLGINKTGTGAIFDSEETRCAPFGGGWGSVEWIDFRSLDRYIIVYRRTISGMGF